MNIDGRKISIVALLIFSSSTHATFFKAQHILKATQTATTATSYGALGAAFALHGISMAYGLYTLMKNKNKLQIKTTQLVLKHFTNTPKILYENLYSAAVAALSISALASLYTSIKMFVNMYKTIHPLSTDNLPPFKKQQPNSVLAPHRKSLYTN